MTQKFLAFSKITVMAKLWNPRLPREVDVSLMGFVVHRRGDFARAQILAIDRCRVYFQVMSIADITSNNGQFIF
jgi:hypothetical protein